MEIIGEAASRISAETRAANPAVPWASIVAMRNRLIHACFDIDRNIVWKTVTEELPSPLSLLGTLLPEEWKSAAGGWIRDDARGVTM
jgi:uncharacterized protein with HEPN domain